MNKLLLYLLVLITVCIAAYYAGKQNRILSVTAQYPSGIQNTAGSVVSSFFASSSAPEFIPTSISIHTLFSDDHSWIATLSGERRSTIIATGDIIPARSVNSQTVKRNSFIWPYEKTAKTLRAADITVINLETPLLKSCVPTETGMSFCGDQRNIEGLLFAGVDVVGLANNHAGNFGKVGIDETEVRLKNAGIFVTGTNAQPVVQDIRGIRFAFLSYNDIGSQEPGIAWADDKKIREDVLKARTVSDVIVVSFHWGMEYQRLPDDRQRYLAHLAVDSGADLVLGNHPHWIQPPEVYKNKFIMYAHGNFIFDQEWSEETKLGVVGKYTFYDTQLIDVEFLPVRIVEYGQPYFLMSSAKDAIVDMIRVSTYQLTK